MSKQESLDEELKGLSPWLRDQSRTRHGMQVPPGYFENMESSVFNKIDADGDRRQVMTTRTGGLLRMFRRPAAWAAAAAVVAIALAAWWMWRPQTGSAVPEEIYVETLTEEDIEEYVLDNITEFDSEQLASIASVEELPEILPEEKTGRNTPSKVIDEISPEEMENLLQQMSEEELESLL